MVGKRARSPDTDGWVGKVGKRLTLRATVDRRAYEGLLVKYHPGWSDGQAKVEVIHTDGLLRRWTTADIELIAVLSDKSFSQKDIDRRMTDRAGRGGTIMGQQLRQQGRLGGKHIQMWNEDSMKWELGEVIDPKDGDKFHVKIEDDVVLVDLANTVWTLDGECPAEMLKTEGDLVVLEDSSIPVVVTQQPASNKMNVYVQTKYCSEAASPQVHVSDKAVHIHDSSPSGDVSRDVVVILRDEHQCDTSEVVEAVLDKEAWLKITFRRRT